MFLSFTLLRLIKVLKASKLNSNILRLNSAADTIKTSLLVHLT